MTRCPACNRELTPDQVELAECPYCRTAVDDPTHNTMPELQGFIGASLEWDPRVPGPADDTAEIQEDLPEIHEDLPDPDSSLWWDADTPAADRDGEFAVPSSESSESSPPTDEGQLLGASLEWDTRVPEPESETNRDPDQKDPAEGTPETDADAWWGHDSSTREQPSDATVAPPDADSGPPPSAPPVEEFPLLGASLEWDPRVVEAESDFQEAREDSFPRQTESWEVNDSATDEQDTSAIDGRSTSPDDQPSESRPADESDRSESQTSQEGSSLSPGGLPTLPDSIIEDSGAAQPDRTLQDSLVRPPNTDTPVLDGSRKDAALPTSGEMSTLDREWGALPDSEVGVTIKSLSDDSETPPERASITDTVEMLPRRKLQASGEEVDHPEYELLEVLGEGGMGVVWNARQTSIDRSVALKMIKAPYARKARQRQKFLAEAVVTGDLDHPNIVPIYDVGLDVRGKLFYAMKRVHGTPWLEVVRNNSLNENLQTLLRVADAVAFAHARGIVHRDIKPENVMLGGFGEVLLMDWGLALPTEAYRKAGNLEFTTGMGGTPAYMAPEMAKGPIEAITPASDIYLLGATLYDIVTGDAPHSAPSVRACLVAAMRNRIEPTVQQGELVDIARKAMATSPGDRYATVQDFQTAIREYLSHEESILLAARAQQDLTSADTTNDYSDFARAVFGFEEAFELWDGNDEARSGIAEAKLAYARSARKKGDFDLGLSLLDPSRSEHRGLHQRLVQDRNEHRARIQRLKVARRTTVLMGAVIFVGAVVTGIHFRRTTLVERGLVEERGELISGLEQRNRDLFDASVTIKGQKDELEDQYQTLGQLNLNLEAETLALDEANTNLKSTIVQRNRALQQEQYKAYVAGIGAAAARIDEGAFDVARTILESLNRAEVPVQVDAGERDDAEDTIVDFRNWEWGRLMYLCGLESNKYPAQAPVEALAVSPDGTKLAVGCTDHFARIFDLDTGQELGRLRHDGSHVQSVAWSPDGRTLATGGNSGAGGYVQLWPIDSDGKPGTSRPLLADEPVGHTEPVCRVRFSPDGHWLLSCSLDQTVQLWNLRNPSESPDPLRGHDWWVWDGAFAPGFNPEDPAADNRIVTVDQDGRAIVWELKKDNADEEGDVDRDMEFVRDRVFLGHEGAIYSVDLSEIDGQLWVATGGHDNRVLLWQPEDVPPYTVSEVFSPSLADMKYDELRGHTDAVESVRFSNDGRLVTSGRDNLVWVWSLDASEQRFRLRGHSNAVHDARFTPDGKRIISAGFDAEIIVWQADRQREFQVLADRRFAGHEDAILSARFSGNDSRIVTASRDRTARLWDARSGSSIAELREGHEYLVSNAVVFDGRMTFDSPLMLATAAADNTVRVWNVGRGAEELQLHQTGRSGVLAVTHDAGRLVTGGSGNLAQVWDMSRVMLEDDYTPLLLGQPWQPEQPEEHQGHKATVTAAACSPIAGIAATGDVNGRTVLWDIDSGNLLWTERRLSHRISGLMFTSNGGELLISSSGGGVERVSVATGSQIEQFTVGGSVSAFDLTRDGERIVIAAVETLVEDRPTATITIRDGTDATTLDSLPFAVHSILITPDERRALLACGDDAVRVLSLTNLAEGIRDEPLLQFGPDDAPLAAATLSDDGARLVTMNGSDARMFDLRDWPDGPVTLSMEFRPQDALADAQFSPDGRLVVTASWDGSVRIWDAVSWTSKATFRAHESFINSVEFSPDGALILTAGDDGTARIWDVAEILDPESSDSEVSVLPGHSAAVNRAIFSPAGDRILTVSSDGSVRLWIAETGAQDGIPFEGHDSAVLSAAFSADGQRIVTGSEDNEARVWDVAGREALAVLSGHTAAVTSVAFSSDASRAFTASRDSTIKVWDVSEFRLSLAVASNDAAPPAGPKQAFDLLTLVGHGREVTSVTISSDDQMILTGSRDGTAILWSAVEWGIPLQRDPELAPIPPAATAAR